MEWQRNDTPCRAQGGMLGKREKHTPDPSRLDNSCPLPLVELMLRSNPLPFRTGAAHNMFFCSLPGIPDCTASAKGRITKKSLQPARYKFIVEVMQGALREGFYR